MRTGGRSMNKTDVEDKKLRLTTKEEYEYIINARNFHYQEFNKWSRYFGLVVSALFVAYYTIQSPEKKVDCQLEILIALMGFIVSMCWYWSNKGYVYWWYHWAEYLMYVEKKEHQKENVVETLESNFKGTVGIYSNFFNAVGDENGTPIMDTKSYFNPVKGANISTSKVILLMSYAIILAWGYILATKIPMGNIASEWKILLCALTTIAVTLILSSVVGMAIKSNISHHNIMKKVVYNGYEKK